MRRSITTRQLPFLLLLLSTVFVVAFAKIDHVKEKRTETHGDATKLKAKEAPEHIDHKKLFTENFKQRRSEHKAAIESIKGIGKDKTRLFLEDLLKNIKNLLKESRETLERTAHLPDSPFPHSSDLLKDALSKLHENTALFTDLSLAFSKFFETKVQKDRKLKTLLVGAYNYSIKTGIFDSETEKKVNLMAQQHELIEKDEKFFNLYDKERVKEDMEAEETQRKQKKSKKAENKQPKGEL
ncbi:hypothetical protein GCK72_008777 [Caenorhabditis remanei]|uniref:Domain of unknown function WSN domain-containing protein n=1 Tax=Caenorhabditis remanei TaxID=31234 RepID=A0A6A5GYH2_CAERE|nr:hypothetical protein GCK72_008777 [Caenorhabditis remanei]KAF1760528.1 hypothetical protein GCK72_008777 [Caenorhabditis remanei]